ncbi:15603_t:CDS:2 [Dentiscutata erythropus]|uniref:15603_t:CDS:1 n=1 Tax=Dentiscutata erythropus TaxID=1348616 RepID=A0A9N9I7D0_9GLOM|nr:15603_t:CDS:2 [Dentiscutata erythropus]
MDQNSSTFQYESKNTSNNILKNNSDSISNMFFELSNLESYNFEHANLSCVSESLYNSEYHNLDSPKNLVLLSDSFNYSDSSNINSLQSNKKHKLVFAILSNKKAKPKKSWVWHYMRKDKSVRICEISVNRNGKIELCGELFSLLISTSTLGAHLHTIYHLLEKEKIRILIVKELINLLEPFARAISLMSGDTYSTLSLILSTIVTLQEHLFKAEQTLTSYPRFKNFEFVPEKFKETKKYLKQKIRTLDKNKSLEKQQLVKPFSNLASFFKSTTTSQQFSAADIELKTYFDIP